MLALGVGHEVACSIDLARVLAHAGYAVYTVMASGASLWVGMEAMEAAIGQAPWVASAPVPNWARAPALEFGAGIALGYHDASILFPPEFSHLWTSRCRRRLMLGLKPFRHDAHPFAKGEFPVGQEKRRHPWTTGDRSLFLPSQHVLASQLFDQVLADLAWFLPRHQALAEIETIVSFPSPDTAQKIRNISTDHHPRNLLPPSWISDLLCALKAQGFRRVRFLSSSREEIDAAHDNLSAMSLRFVHRLACDARKDQDQSLALTIVIADTAKTIKSSSSLIPIVRHESGDLELHTPRGPRLFPNIAAQPSVERLARFVANLLLAEEDA